ncbi:MAG: peptidylprolyl isomerase [Clostridia bacterium]|nr:peptidylprolyl isomerase [Clostridia bacterium]
MLIFIVTLTGCENGSNTVKSNNYGVNSNSANYSSNSKSSTNSSKEQKNITQEDIDATDFVANAEKQLALPNTGETIAVMHIKDYGDIKIKFFKDVAPKAVENFTKHAKEGYYNGVTFHRVINDFMIQGGDPTGTGAGGKSIWGKDFEDEFSLELVPYRGALCMANAGANTNGSQFFIEQASYDENVENLLSQYGYPENLLEAYKIYGGSMSLFFVHTVFGQVIEGMEVVDKIAETETDANDRPTEDVIIESIEITKY